MKRTLHGSSLRLWACLLLSLLLLLFASALAEDDGFLILPASVTVVEDEAFFEDLSVRLVLLPKGCEAIRESAFEGCAQLSYVNIPEGVLYIGDAAFHDCPSLTAVTLPASLTDIGPEAFDSTVTARVYEDSAAHQWCIDNDVPFELISESGGSASELEEAREVMPGSIIDIQSQFENASGGVPNENLSAAIAAVADYLDGEKAAGRVVNYAVDRYGARYIDAARGELWAWSPNQSGMMSGGGDGITSSVVTLQAFGYGEERWGDTITRKLDNFTGAEMKQLTFDNIKNMLGPNQVVIIRTHGGLGAGYCHLATEVEYYEGIDKVYNTKVVSPNDMELWEEELDVVHMVAGENTKVEKDTLHITPFFITHHCKRMDNSMIYLGACHTTEASKLANAFYGKGAAAVVGFNNKVSDKYGDRILEALIDKMCSINKDTGSYYTLGEAMDAAVKKYPNDDPKKYSKDSVGATPRILREIDKSYSLVNATIQGSVVHSGDHSTPVAGAKVVLRASDASDGETFELTTDAEGRYSFSLGAPGDTYQLWVEINGIKSEVRKLSVKRGETHTEDFEIGLIRFTGRVYSLLYKTKLSDAKISCVVDGETCASTQSGGDGSFELFIPSECAQKIGTFVFEAQDHDPKTYKILLQQDGEFRLPIKSEEGKYVSLTASTEIVRGVILDRETEEPVSGATVTLLDENGAPVPEADTCTDGDGTFLLVDLPHGKFILRVEADGYAVHRFAVELKDGEGYDGDLFISPPGRFTVRVTDKRGKLLSDARFELRDEHDIEPYITEIPAPEDPTGLSVSGEYTLEVAPGTYDLTVRRDGYAEKTVSVTVEEGQNRPITIVQLDNASEGTITVRVTDAEGNAVIGARFALADADGNAVELLDPVEVFPSGKYRLTAYAGEYSLTVSATGCNEKTTSVTVRGEQDTLLSVKLDDDPVSEGTITVHVTDAEGNAITGARFALADAEGNAVALPKPVEVISDGEYRLTAPVGEYSLTVSATGCNEKTPSVTVRDKQDTSLSVKLDAELVSVGTITVYVTDAWGCPISNAWFSLYDPDGNATASLNSSEVLSTGKYIMRVYAGTYTVNIYAHGYDGKKVSVTVGDRQDTSLSVMLECGKSSECLEYTYDSATDSYAVTGYQGEPGLLAIPSVYNGKPVTRIGERAFFKCYSLGYVAIPGSVTSIEISAFSRCHYLWGVSLSEGITSIGSTAFSVCMNLTKVALPDSVTSLGTSVFSRCTRLQNVTLSKGLTRIDNYTFSSCEKLPGITIPSGVTEIGSEAFAGCTNLKTVSLPDTLTRIVGGAFEDCYYLEDINIPDSVTYIGNSAFLDCQSLPSITLPDSITQMGFTVFDNCKVLKKIYVKKGSYAAKYVKKYYSSLLTYY